MSQPTLRRTLRLVVFALALVGALAGILSLWIHLTEDPLADFRAYYDAGARLNAGRTLYLPEIDPFDPAYYRYPPLLAILMRPVAALVPYQAAAAIWLGILVAATVLTIRVLGARRQATWLAMGILGLPIAWALAIGQAQVLVTLFLAIAAPWSVALAAQLKVLPALAALYWVGRRDWPALGRFVAISAGLVAFQAVLAPGELLAFPGVLGPEHVGPIRNLSPYVTSPILWLALVLAGSVATAPPGEDPLGLGRGRVPLRVELAATARLHAEQPLGRGPASGASPARWRIERWLIAARGAPSVVRRIARLALYGAAFVGAVLGIVDLWYWFTLAHPIVDFHAYYEAAARLNAGQTLYLPERDPFFPDFYRYPPLLAILMRPLALLDYETAARVWFGILLGATILTAVVLGVRRRATWLAMGILGLPLAWSLGIGQAQVLVTLFLAIGSPWAIALATQIKILPALVALYWIGRRDWRSLGEFIGISAALLVFQLVLAPTETLDFPKVFGLDQVGVVSNLSPYGVSRLLWVGLVVAGAIATLVLARTRWGWAAAVSLSVLSSPRLLLYMFSSLWATVRQPEPIATPDPAVAGSPGPTPDATSERPPTQPDGTA